MERLLYCIGNLLGFVGMVAFKILYITWVLVATLVCLIAGLLSLPMAKIKRDNRCVGAIAGIWLLCVLSPATWIGINKGSINGTWLENFYKERDIDTEYDFNEECNYGKNLFKNYWNDGES